VSEIHLAERVMAPDADRRRGLRVWADMLADLWSSRELLLRLAHRDIAVSYRQSLLGYLWVLVLPLATVALFTYLSSMRIIPIGATALPYPAYALWGVVLWQLFASTLIATTSSLAHAGSLVTKIDFPKEVIVFGALGKPLLEFLVKLLLVVALFVFYGVGLHATALLVLPIVLLVLMMATGIGLMLSLANLVVRDVANLVTLVTTFGLFAAPVLYPPPLQEPFSLLVILNPFSPLLMASQDLLSEGALRHPQLLSAGALFAVLCLLLGWRMFRVVIRRVTERA
jgi:lipopolysaccharide transport system permease protein